MKIIREKTENEILCRTALYDGKAFLYFHWHENIEICQVMSNSGKFLIDGVLIEAKKGDILVIGAQVVHQFCIDVPDTKVRIFQMSPKVIMDKDVSAKDIKTHITSLEIESVPPLKERLDTLFDIVQTDGGAERVGDKPYIKTVAASLYYMLMYYFTEETNTKSHKDRQLFYKITDYVNEHFAEDITVQIISEKLYVSRGKVGRVLAKYSGITLNRYINDIRIKNANMLMDSGLGITESALESGFQNIRTFNEVYKKTMGITPTEYMTK